MNNDFSRGPVWRRILVQSVPLMLAQLVQLLYNIVDRIYLGHMPGVGSAVLTGVGVFDRIGQYAGAGAFVPISGFANAMVSPAMEFRREGLVLGLGAKLFSIAGPVLVWGISTACLLGIVYAVFPW